MGLTELMSELSCPLCTVDELTESATSYECLTCGHEWDKELDTAEESQVVKDAFGNVLQDGDIVQMIKDKKLKGTSTVLKSGDKSKPIRVQEGDHEISCKMNGFSINLKAMYVKKVF